MTEMVWSSKNRRHKEEMVRIYRRTIQKDLHYPDNHDDMISHLEPDILECKVEWVLGSITMNKASGGNGWTGRPGVLRFMGLQRVGHD